MRRFGHLLLGLACSSVALAADAPEKPILVLDAGGHTAAVKKVLFTPDGRELITVSYDKTIRTWDVASGAPLRVLRPPIGAMGGGLLFAAALTPDGRTLAAGGTGWRPGEVPIYLIDLAAGRILRVLTGHASSINSLAFSPDGARLASGSSDRTSRIWSASSGQCELVLEGHEDAVYGVAFAPDGRHLATASYDKTGRIWSVADGRCEAVLRGHEKEVQCIAWRPDGRVVATGGLDESIRQWSPDGSASRGFEHLGGRILSLTFSADSRTLLFTRGLVRPRTCSLLDLATGQERVRFDRHTNSVLHGAISPDGTLAATTGGNDHETFIWRLTDAAVVHRLAGGGRSVWAVAWGPDGESLAWGNTSKPVSQNDLGPLERTFRLADLELSGGVSPDDHRSAPTLGTLRLEIAGTALVVKEGADTITTITMADPRERILSYTLLPGDRVAIGADFGLYLFDARSGKPLHVFVGHSGLIFALAPSPDGRRLLSGSADQTLRIWDPAGIERVSAADKRAGIGLRTAFEGGLHIIRGITPGLPASRDQRLKLGDRIIAIAQEAEGFVELQGKTFAEYSAMVWGVAGTRVRLRTSRDGVDGTSEYEFKRENPSTPIVSIFVAGDDWVAWSPAGYYAASPGGEQLMGWHVNNGPEVMASYYPAAQFRKTLYRPDVIKRLLGTGSLTKALAEADAAAGQATRQTEVAQILPPKVAITSPAFAQEQVNGKTLQVEAVARSVGANPVTEMRVLLDGRPVPDGLKTFPSPVTGEVRARWTVEVAPGSHRLVVQASSAVSKGLSGPVEVVAAASDDNTSRAAGRLFLLVIGINDYLYLGDRFKLDCAAPDARSIHKAFHDLSRPLFRSIEARLLLDREATRANILGALQWLKQGATAGDKAVVFYAGHGDNQIAGQFYIIPVDGRLDDLRSSGVSDDELKKAIGDLPCTTLLMLDACDSGGFGMKKKRKTRSLAKPTDALAGSMVNDYGLATLCGARDNQAANEEGGHGFFTQALTQGMAGEADTDQDGLVELYELLPFVCSRVKKLSAGDQVPTFGLPQSIESFALSKP